VKDEREKYRLNFSRCSIWQVTPLQTTEIFSNVLVEIFLAADNRLQWHEEKVLQIEAVTTDLVRILDERDRLLRKLVLVKFCDSTHNLPE